MNSALQGESHFWTKLYMLTSAWGVEMIILKRVGDRKKFPHTSQDWTLADKARLEDKLCSDKYGQEEKLCWDKCGQWLKCVQTKVDRARNCSHPSNSRFSSLTIFSFQMEGENCVQNNLDGKIKMRSDKREQGNKMWSDKHGQGVKLCPDKPKQG